MDYLRIVLILASTVSNFSANEQQQMQRIVEQKQMKDFMKLYTGLVERCFDACCNDFTSKALSSKEVGRPIYARRERTRAEPSFSTGYLHLKLCTKMAEA